jgi:hypothetical protein
MRQMTDRLWQSNGVERARPRSRTTDRASERAVAPASAFDFGRLPLQSPIRIQPKLAVGQPNDPLEQEADRAADHALNMTERDVARAHPGETARPSAGAVARKATQAGHSPTGSVDAPSSVGEVLNAPGAPLDAESRAFFEPRLGFDFAKVRVHADDRAAESAHDVNAHAYTAGSHVVFGAGRYAPRTEQGRKLLGHELAHVVQQNGATGQVQRLIRTPYPWNGVITPAIGARVRSAPDSKDASNIVDSIPKGTSVTVLSASGDWLKISEAYKGKTIEGYVHNTLVDDPVAAKMDADVGTAMTWLPSGPGSGTDFETWASAAKEAPFPAISSSTVMNCWEAVLTSAFKAGSINWKWIHDLYKSGPSSGWPALMAKGARQKYTPGGKTFPQRGDLVFFDDMGHVAMATGKGSEVYTFWPPPKSPWAGGATVDKVKKETIESLDTWWKANTGSSFKITFGPPNW